jgi:hypothetical protein
MKLEKINDNLVEMSLTDNEIKNAAEIIAYFRVINEKLVDAARLLDKLEGRLSELSRGFLDFAS